VIAIKYDDLWLAFDFVSSAPPMENNAYIAVDTGVIYWRSEVNPVEKDVPDDLETSDRYITIPHKNDLDLGRSLALRFAAQEIPDRYEQAKDFFRREGAYGRFKQLLEIENVLEKRYKYEAECGQRALREWCAENGIEICQNDGDPSA
jgi:hypothetical protein